MAVCHGSNLRQMRDADNLMIPGDHCQLFCHPLGCATTDAGVDLIEDQGWNVITVSQHGFYCQHNTGKLTT